MQAGSLHYVHRYGLVNDFEKSSEFALGFATKTMPGEAFVERYAMHILPARFSRTRYGGFLNGPVRKKALEAIREKVGEVEPPPEAELPKADVPEGNEDEFVPETDYPCVKCGARSMKWIAFIEATRGMASVGWRPTPRFCGILCHAVSETG